MLHDKASQAITRKMTADLYLQNYHPLIHENDWERSFCIASNATCQSQSTDESKGDCGLLQSESLFAAALNRRSSSFRTLSHKTGVNANPLTGTNDA